MKEKTMLTSKWSEKREPKSWPTKLFCKTLIDTPNNGFEIDLSKKSDPPCPGANYVCFGYALLFYDPITDAIQMTHEVVNIPLDELPWKSKDFESGVPLKRLGTMGFLYGNRDKSEQAVMTVSKYLDCIMARTLCDISSSLYDCRDENFISKEAYEKALARD